MDAAASFGARRRRPARRWRSTSRSGGRVPARSAPRRTRRGRRGVEGVASASRRRRRDAEIIFDFREVDGELQIEAHCGSRSSEVRCPLPADVRAISRPPVPVIPMRLFNTLTRREEEFAPSRDNTVRMYTCGLTVYARGHIGNFRTFVARRRAAPRAGVSKPASTCGRS